MNSKDFQGLTTGVVVSHKHLGVCTVVFAGPSSTVGLYPQDPYVRAKYGGITMEKPIVENRKRMIEGFVQSCDICGCSETNACILPGKPNCHWHDENTCSHCVTNPGEAKRYFEIVAEKVESK